MPDSPFANLLLPHIAAMEPYTPIQPFEVLSRQLGRAPERDRQAGCQRESVRPGPGGARGAGGLSLPAHLPRSGAARAARRAGGLHRRPG